MHRITSAILVSLFLQFPAFAQVIENSRAWKEIPTNSEKVVSLGEHEMSCGYAAVLNALSFGNEEDKKVFLSIKGDGATKLDELEKKYGNIKSVDDCGGKRMTKDGISAQDLLLSYNELRVENKLTPLKGDYLDRNRNESKFELGKRVHKLLLNSLNKGEPPVIMLRAQVAHFENKKTGSLWNEITGHFLTVVALPVDTNSDGSFSLDYLDSYDGKKHELFVYPEIRDFLAAKGTPVKSKSNWIDGYPFLAVAASSLNLDLEKEAWNERTIIYLHHAIYKD